MNPFESHSFFHCLEVSEVIGEEVGHQKKLFEYKDSYLYGFVKNHSYGEYIFDWSWAQAYERSGLNYYPKLIHYTPYTPVNAFKLNGENKNELIEMAWDFYQKYSVSSQHYLFIQPEEVEILSSKYLIRDSLQFHFYNEFDSFEDYLNRLKKSKRKTIKKERREVKKLNLNIQENLIKELSDDEIIEVYQLYLLTVSKKNAYAYLKLETFLALKKYMPQNLMVYRAFENDRVVAMSLFFLSEEVIYGRYWGCIPEFEKSCLHFELCYYKGIEFVIDHKIPLFEAGAQGVQKLLRGFKPVVIKSAHHLKHSEMHKAVEDFIIKEKTHIALEYKNCLEMLPFKK